MDILDFDYARALRHAQQVENIAEEMTHMVNSDLSQVFNAIESAWVGEASVMFQSHLSKTKQEIQSEAQDLRDAAKRIRRIAAILKQAEEDAEAAMD